MSSGGTNCTGVSAPAYLSFLTASVSLVLFLVTVPGNLLVCLAVYKDPRHDLRTPFNLFVVNLAFADLVVGLLVEPTSIVIHLQEGLTDGPLAGIVVIHLAYFISCTASVLSLAALTVDRYIAVTCPFFYRTRLNSARAGGASLVIWVLSAALSCIYFQVGYIKYAFVFANTAAILTLVILLVSYLRIYRRVHSQFSKSEQLHPGHDQLTRRTRAAQKEARVTKAFLLVLTAYLLCYAPSCAMIYVMNLCTSCSCYTVHWLRDMQFLFVLLNSSLNPFLYSWRLPNFRNAFTIIMRTRPNRHRNSLRLSTTSNEGVRNLWAETVESSVTITSALMHVAMLRPRSENLQMRLTSGGKYMLQTRKQLTGGKANYYNLVPAIKVQNEDSDTCEKADSHSKPDSNCFSQLDVTKSFREDSIPRRRDKIQSTRLLGNLCGSSDNLLGDSGYAEGPDVNSTKSGKRREKFKQTRASSLHVSTRSRRLHGRVLRSASLT